ncbi:MAG: sugar ABC transporter substrate-binding protein [Chloroflexi bacterium]|nr:sugar ABC transporter substrate-binding protein [Chloroflexota bacterium]MCY4248278.1 sugar ABC transporter substrate-binding protein [Chloroflexota bacterium]
MSGRISRRKFLRYTGLGGAAALASAYGLPLGAALAQAPPSDISEHLVVYNFGGAQHQEVFANAIARFNEVYPNVTVEDLYIPSTEGWGGFTTNILLRIRSGLQTDVIAIAIEGAHELIASGALLPLDDAIAADAALQEVEADSHPALAAGLAGRDGSAYFITREWNNMIFHYNTDMFEAAGLGMPDPMWTWDDFLDTALTLTSGEGGDKVFGYVIPFFFFGLQPWFHTNGTGVLTDDWSQSNLDDPKMLESVKFIHSLVHEHGVAPAPEGTDSLGLFTSERAAMVCFGRWTFANYIANDFRQVDIVPWPRKESGTTVFGSGGWAITKSASNVPLALELIKEFSSVETDVDSIRFGTFIPSRRSSAQREDFLAFPDHAHYFWDSLDDIKPVPSPANFAEMSEIFMRHMGDIMANIATPEQGLEAAHIELTAAMDRLAERMSS